MNIRLTRLEELPQLMLIYEKARAFMQATGNANQWINGYPSADLIRQEIEEGHSYVCIDEAGEVVGTFCFIIGEDPTYQQIYEGAWLNDEPYGVVHRLATNGMQKGVADACLSWCFHRIANIRVDTHRDNQIMQHILKKHNFQYCGIILVKNGTERIAFQKAENLLD